MLHANLAKKIVQEVRKLLNEEIVVMDTNGIIIAATNQTRIGQFHEGALLTCKSKQKLIISLEDEKNMMGVKAGINLPIFTGEHVVGVIGITGSPEAVSQYGELLKRMTELLIKESIYIEETGRHIRAMETFIFDWLELREWDPTFINRAERLGIDINVSRQLVLIKMENNPQPSQQLIEKWHNTLEKNELLIRWGHDRLLLLLDADNPLDQKQLRQKLSTWKKIMKDDLIFGVGNITPAKDLKKSFLQAERALRSVKGTEWIVFDEDLTLEMIIDDVRMETKALFIERTLKPILMDFELIETLKAYFQHDYSIKATANHLHIHINTLHYRLKKTEELTGLNPKQTRDQTILYIALQILDEYTN
ncbi:helix-turn-helix domain-containing protein [Bacillus sp. APMAM]|nr:helix-turn-helix domain-containing protein [Bacillus sp. APMAM]